MPQAAAGANDSTCFESPVGGVQDGTLAAYVPAPKDLPAFPKAQPSKRKTPVQGGGGFRKRWMDPDGNIYEWDSQHGRVEKYDRKGRHLGEFDPSSGQQVKDTDKTRRVEP